jgi:hypothetical protein
MEFFFISSSKGEYIEEGDIPDNEVHSYHLGECVIRYKYIIYFCVCMYVCINEYIYIFIHIYVTKYAPTKACMYIYLYICIYIYIYLFM